MRKIYLLLCMIIMLAASPAMAAKNATVAYSGNATKSLASLARHNATTNNYTATVMVWGGFGSGTLAFFVSPDNGVTLVPLQDLTGAAVTMTAAGMVEVNFGNGTTPTDTLKMYGTLSGSTSPTLSVAVYDNQ